MALSDEIDGRAVATGASVAVVICLPLALLSQVVADADDGGEPSDVVFLFLVGVLAGFAVGGYVAGRRAGAAPFTNGALAALGAFVVIQGVAVLVRLLTDEGVSIAAVVFNALVAYASGLVGGFLAGRRDPRSLDS